MSIKERDLKILWGKAAARCAITRKLLVASASEAVPSKNILVGENCHIVAESEEGPRGTSILTADERNRYPNLILLCREEHTRIDQDPIAWPIERLHQIKADHELWVEECLAEAHDAVDELYATLINRVTDGLRLERWNEFSDDILRGLVPVDWVDTAGAVLAAFQRSNWPGKYPELEKAIQNLAAQLEAYISCYMEHSILGLNPERYQEDKWYRRYPEGHERMCASKVYNAWRSLCTKLLLNLTAALNQFADAVRRQFKADYFLVGGKFCVADSMGVTNGGEGRMYVPETIQDVGEIEKLYRRWAEMMDNGRGDDVWEEWEAYHKEQAPEPGDF